MLIDVLFALHDRDALSKIVPSCLELNPTSAKYRILHEYLKRDQRALKHLKSTYPKQFAKCSDHLNQLRTLCDFDEHAKKISTIDVGISAADWEPVCASLVTVNQTNDKEDCLLHRPVRITSKKKKYRLRGRSSETAKAHRG
eukprot:TRINITY_DN3639_c0_g1_i1.p1 TRINITY_DN3639_c0_g1~~TRINITY_DN3639_c0_g1_i1.p1  ORF type:complete len:142 (+),score=38.25 TRINITY_DN3639_c0_g1_i1:209-634(+)